MPARMVQAWTAAQTATWERVCDKLVTSALAQPQVPPFYMLFS